jgi:4-amino-4-deoxychorismate lyase
MSPLFETIRIENHQIHNLTYHEARLNASRKALFGIDKPLHLHLNADFAQLTRCKVIYAQEILSVEYHSYTPKNYRDFTVVEKAISYPHKYLERSVFDGYDEKAMPIFVHEGLVSDTSIANLAFCIDGVWQTPAKPLLHGTMRAKLLDEQKFICADVRVEDIAKATKIAMINAMIGFKIIEDFTLV